MSRVETMARFDERIVDDAKHLSHCCICDEEIGYFDKYIEFDEDAICMNSDCSLEYLKQHGTILEQYPF